MEAAPIREPGDQPTIVIEPVKGWRLPSLSEVWRYRDLVYFLARRDVVIRYKQAIVGLGWAVVQPLLLAGLFALFFGVIVNIASVPGMPYPLFAVSGLVIWIAFTNAVQMGTLSTVTSEQLITKIYFPRILIPFAAVAPSAVDMTIGLLVVVFVALPYGFFPDVRILVAPFILLLAMIISMGFAVWFSALNAKYRDFNELVRFMLLAGLFITPIIYPLGIFLDSVPAFLHPLYAVNPMVGVLEAFRWSVLGVSIDPALVVAPLVGGPLLLLSGALYFERAQRSFADVI